MGKVLSRVKTKAPKRGVRFHIGTRSYEVRRKWALTCDGERVNGICFYSTRTIWLDAALEEGVITDILRHEHFHAWEYEVGSPRTQEDRANFGSTVSAAFEAEFNEQGGLSALMDLPIYGIAPTGTALGLSVGPWRYSIKVAEGDLRDGNGNLTAGTWSWADRTIQIAGNLTGEQRLDVLFHEAAHAWQHHFGRPTTEEETCNRFSSFAVDVWRQLEAQGGYAGLSAAGRKAAQ